MINGSEGTVPSAEEKLQALELMAGGIAHNINNSLLPIMGYLRLARVEIAAGSPLAAYVEHMEAAAGRMARLSGDLLAIAGKGINRLEDMDISVLVGSFAKLLETGAKKPVELRCMLAQDLPSIRADLMQVRQAVTTLVTNGVEAVGESGGIITIRSGASMGNHSPGKSTVVVGEPPRGEMVFLEVSDNGCGIPPEIMGRIFDPFFSTRLAGRGLGLAAVQGIMRSHGGAVMVESRPGEGSTFRLLFPAAPRPEEARLSRQPYVPDRTIVRHPREPTAPSTSSIL
ncbi:MAG TPA: ATP-binding protein [Geobacteraceae bacterium]|nr:ATP-binding protein [Geobacteraceae bacterium]